MTWDPADESGEQLFSPLTTAPPPLGSCSFAPKQLLCHPAHLAGNDGGHVRHVARHDLQLKIQSKHEHYQGQALIYAELPAAPQSCLACQQTRYFPAGPHLAQQHVLEHGHGARVVQRAQLLKGLEEVGVGGLVVLLLCRSVE